MTLLVGAALSMAVASVSLAAGTLATTPVNNRAVVNYDLAGTAQTFIESDPAGNSTPGLNQGANTQFLVDNIVDFTVTDATAAYVQVAPGATAQVLTFTIQNDGNETQDFSLSATELVGGADPYGGTDDFNGSGGGIFVESNPVPDGYDAADVDTWADNVDPDTSATVYVVRDIGAGETDDTSSAIILVAQVAAEGGVGTQGADILTDDSGSVDLPGTVQIVFADAAGDEAGDVGTDGVHSDTGAFQVVTATLEIEKDSEVISDPITGPLGPGVFPKAIPGAIIEYTITVTNTAGSGTATSVTITDDIDTHITAGDISFYTDGYGAGFGIEITDPILYGGAATAMTNASGDDEGEFDGGTNTLTVDSLTVGPGQTATVRYQVEVTQ